MVDAMALPLGTDDGVAAQDRRASFALPGLMLAIGGLVLAQPCRCSFCLG